MCASLVCQSGADPSDKRDDLYTTPLQIPNNIPAARERRRSLALPHSKSLPQTQTNASSVKYTGYGGFPTPLRLVKNIALRYAPEQSARLGRTLTQEPTMNEAEDPQTGFLVGRNSRFLKLTHEQKEELGGIEYRASKLLLIIVSCVSAANWG